MVTPSITKKMIRRNKDDKRRSRSYRKWERDRYLQKLERERRELWNQLGDAPIRKLDEPYQRGWERFFVLSEEAKRRKDSDRLREVLKIVQRYQRAKSKDFYKPCWSKWGRKKRMKHRLKSFTAKEFLKQKVPDELLQYFMTQNRRPISPRSRLRELVRSEWGGRIFLAQPHYFQRVVKPYMITHEKVALPEVERRLSEVEDVLWSPPNSGRLSWLNGYRYGRWRRLDEQAHERKVERFVSKEVEDEILEVSSSAEFWEQTPGGGEIFSGELWKRFLFEYRCSRWGGLEKSVGALTN